MARLPHSANHTHSSKPLARPISRRSFLRLAGMGAAGAALAACTPATPAASSMAQLKVAGGTPGSGPVQLVFQDWSSGRFPVMAQSMIEQFSSSNPNIRVFYTPDPENMDIKMLSDFEAGIAPDVFDGCCDYLPAWAQQGYLLDLRPYVQADLDQGTIADWDKAQYEALFLSDGTQFALPKYHGALALYYNKDLFDEFQVDYPDSSWTHDDYLQAMTAIHKFDGTAQRHTLWGSMVETSWERIQMHVNGWGGHFVDPLSPTTSLMAEPEAMAAMEWLRARMWDDHTMANPLEVQNQEPKEVFIEGRVAMIEEGSCALRDILENANFRIGVTSLPAGPFRKVTLSTTDGYAIYAGTQHPEASWELLKHLVSREHVQAMTPAHLLQPARVSLIDEWVHLIQEQYPVQTKEMDLAVFAEGQRNGYSETIEVFQHMTEARGLAQSAWEQIYTLGRSPVDIMQTVSAQIDEVQRTSA